jgi:hypothetical protein
VVTVGVYVTLLGAGLALTFILNPHERPAMIFRMWSFLLLVVQGALLIYFSGAAITQAIRRDTDRKIIDSHRLMPLSPRGAVLGYLVGPSITAMEFAAVNFLVGTLCVAESTGNVWRWIFGNVAILCLAVLLWTIMACASFLGKNLGILSVVGMAIAAPAAPAIYSYVAPVRVLAAPLVASVFDPLMSSPVLETMAPVGLVVQGLFALIFFCAAVRRYRQDDVPALHTPLAFYLLGTWVMASVIGVVFGEVFAVRGLEYMDANPGTLGVVSIVVSMGIALLAVSAAARVSTEWVRTTLAIGKAQTRRPVNPSVLAILAAAIICTVAMAGLPEWMGHVRSMYEARVWILTMMVFCIAGCFLLSMSYLLRVFYRAGTNPLVIILGWVFLTWALPEAGHVFGYRHGYPPVVTLISPPSLLAEMWRSKHRVRDIEVGIIGQFALLAVTAMLFHMSERKIRQRRVVASLAVARGAA